MNSDFSFEIRIVCDEICAQLGFLAGFGFSALIYNNISKTHLLFDAGSKGDCHCTLKIREIKQRFFKQFIDVCVGKSYLF